MPGRLAFTLLELLVVLTLLAICTAIATVPFRRLAAAARAEHEIGRIAAFDQAVRSHAQRSGRETLLAIDVRTGVIATESRRKSTRPLPSLRVGGHLRIVGVQSGRRQFRTGRARIAFNDRGQSATYTMQLVGPDARKHWLMFCGLTGKMIRFQEEKQVRDVSRLASTPRPDAS